MAKGWDLDTLLRLVRVAGFEGVELRTTHAHGVEPSLTPAQRATVRSKCADAGLTQVSLGSVCEFHSPDAAVVRRNVEECRQWVLLAKDIGAKGIKVRPNGLPKDVPEEKTLAQIGRALAECGGFAKEHGLEIWMEVHGEGTKLPVNSRRIMDACAHPSVGLTWNSNDTDVSTLPGVVAERRGSSATASGGRSCSRREGSDDANGPRLGFRRLGPDRGAGRVARRGRGAPSARRLRDRARRRRGAAGAGAALRHGHDHRLRLLREGARPRVLVPQASPPPRGLHRPTTSRRTTRSTTW